MNKEAYINELSFSPVAKCKDEVNNTIDTLIGTLKEAKKNGFNMIRCSEGGIAELKLSDGYSIADFCNGDSRNPKAIALISMIAPPYFKDDSDEADRFVMHRYQAIVDGREIEAMGLVAAFIHRSIAVNLCNAPLWGTGMEVKIVEYDGARKTGTGIVCTVSKPEEFQGNSFLLWMFKNNPIGLTSCNINPQNKVCKLSSTHHGNDKLEKYAKTHLFPLPYIIGVITSQPFQHKGDRFVKQIFPEEFSILVTLFNEEPSYSMLVKTTAASVIELKQIAYELESKFGKPIKDSSDLDLIW